MVIVVPLVQHFAGQVARADKFGKQFPRQSEIPPVHTAHQILPCDRHILRILRADEIMAFIRTGSAMHAAVHVHLERTVLAKQVAHFGNGFVMPVVHQLARKAQGLIHFFTGNIRAGSLHRTRLQCGNDGNNAVSRCSNFRHASSPIPFVSPRLRYGVFRGDCLPGCGRARKTTRVHATTC